MHNGVLHRIAWLLAGPMLFFTLAQAQEPGPEDETINTIRQLPKIDEGDQRRIADWVQVKLNKLAATEPEKKAAAAVAFRKTFKTQFENPANSPAFKAQLATQTAVIAAGQFADAKLDQQTAFGLARVLDDMGGAEATPGFIAGLKSKHDLVRYHCADGLSKLKPVLAADKAKLDPIVQALRAQALVETSPVALTRIYLALAHNTQVPVVFDAYIAIFEKRLNDRRGGAVKADGAEVDAFEFFRLPNVLSTLNPDQKAQLARQLAVFLRLDAERYQTTGLDFYEVDGLERTMEGGEAILVEILGAGKGGKVYNEIGAGGQDKRAEVLAETYKWVGHPQSKEPGPLNAAPWNVPVGAP